MTEKLEKLTESVTLKLLNRVAGVLMMPLILWVIHDLARIHDDNITYAIRLTAHDQQIANHEIRIDNLEGVSRRADATEWKP